MPTGWPALNRTEHGSELVGRRAGKISVSVEQVSAMAEQLEQHADTARNHTQPGSVPWVSCAVIWIRPTNN